MDKLAIFGGQPAVTESWPKWPFAGERERELVDEVLSSSLWGATGLGPKIREATEKVAAYCGVSYGAALANGTVTMELCFKAWGIGPGDEVIVPAFTFMATAMAVHNVGATVVYADVDPLTLNLDPVRAAEAVTERTRAIVPVHLAGHPVDMDSILELAGKHGLKVLEDAAQGLGAIYKGRMVGSLGDAASLSLQQSKRLQSGEGGIIVSKHRELIDLIHYSLSKFGRGIRENYVAHVHHRHGTNYSYTELQAAVLLAQFERFEEQTRLRAANAQLLYGLLDGIPGIELLEWQPYCDRHGENAFVYLFKSDEFEGVSRAQHLAALHAEGIPAMSWYPSALYDQPLYRAEPHLSERHRPSPFAEMAAREACFLENHIMLADRKQLVRLAEGIRKVRVGAPQLRDVQVDEETYMGSSVLAAGRANAVGSGIAAAPPK